MKRKVQEWMLRAPKRERRAWRLRSRGHEGRSEKNGEQGVCVRGGRDSGNQASVFQGGGRVLQFQTRPPPQGSKKMTVMATLDLAPNNISRRDRSQKGQRRERRNCGAVSEGVGGQETFSRRWGDQRIGS